MKIIHDGLRLCSDCTLGAINGDFSGMDNETEIRVIQGLERLGANLVPSFDSETGEGCDEFSWAHCDCCRSKLGGSRRTFAILGE